MKLGLLLQNSSRFWPFAYVHVEAEGQFAYYWIVVSECLWELWGGYELRCVWGERITESYRLSIWNLALYWSDLTTWPPSAAAYMLLCSTLSLLALLRFPGREYPCISYNTLPYSSISANQSSSTLVMMCPAFQSTSCIVPFISWGCSQTSGWALSVAGMQGFPSPGSFRSPMHLAALVS